MSPPASSQASQHRLQIDSAAVAAASLLCFMQQSDSGREVDGETSDEQQYNSDGANACNGVHSKGQPWTESEHRAFVAGVAKLGKGQWRGISKQFVPTRTPTQVASHAQKYFMRLAGATKRKSRFTALENEVLDGGKKCQSSMSEQVVHAQPLHQQHPHASFQPPASGSAVPPQQMMFPMPFMHPMMFGFPPPFFPPFMCPPPAFAAAAMSAMQKQGACLPPMMGPMSPMGMLPPGMMAMHPFMMMQQMACAAQAAAVAAAAAAHHHAQAAASGAAPAQSDDATDDTANSGDIAARRAAKAVEASAAPAPSVAQPAAAAAAAATQVCGGAAEPAKPSRKRVADAPAEVNEQQKQKRAAVAPAAAAPAAAAAAAPTGAAPASASPTGGCLRQSLVVTRTCSGGEEGAGGSPGAMFQASPHSAFRPPQEIKAES